MRTYFEIASSDFVGIAITEKWRSISSGTGVPRRIDVPSRRSVSRRIGVQRKIG